MTRELISLETERPIRRNYHQILNIIEDDEIQITIDEEKKVERDKYQISGTTTIGRVTREYVSDILLREELEDIKRGIRERK